MDAGSVGTALPARRGRCSRLAPRWRRQQRTRSIDRGGGWRMSDRAMRRILARLELVSHGSVQAWNASGGHSGEPDDRIVALIARGTERYPHELYREAYNLADTDKDRAMVLEQAAAELKSIIKRASAGNATLSFDDLVIEDGQGYSVAMAAHHFNVSSAFIRRVRVRRGRDPEDGRQPVEVVDRAARARELRAQGLSTREIALMVGTNLKQVWRWTVDKSGA
jgi:hypothetical protein